MPQSLSRIWLHIVFSTKNREAFLQDEALREEMFKMLGHHAKELDCPPLVVGGWIDHVHVLCGLSRTVTVANWWRPSSEKHPNGPRNVRPFGTRSIGRTDMAPSR